MLSFFFSLHKADAQRGVADVLAVLEVLAVFVCERPTADQQKLRSAQVIMDAFSDVCLVIDAKEQRIQRPSGSEEKGHSHQKPFYSGKKAHTLAPLKPQDAGGGRVRRQFSVGGQDFAWLGP